MSLLRTVRPKWKLREAADGNQAIEAVRDGKPDLIVLDITMPGDSGLEVASKLRKAGFDRPILMFTMHQSERLGSDALQAGAQGYVLKSDAAEQLVQAIDVLLDGGTFYGKPSVSPPPSKPTKSGLSFCIGLRPVFA